jgi:putative ATP-dependent endonuclease of OLD family
MARIIQLDIKNFRGIKELSLSFRYNQALICLIGRGDSGKTTILDAISSVLSPSWNMIFYDTDFYQCNPSESIEIQATLIDIPPILISENKYGLHTRSFNTQTNAVADDVYTDNSDALLKPALTIKTIIDESLEPKWVVTNTREQEDISISASDRAHLNCYLISDYIDRHFSWNQGNPLYTLLKSTESENVSDKKNVIIQSLREAKQKIDNNGFDNLNEATDLIKHQALELGLDISGACTTLDFKELSIKDGRITLHDAVVPFRQKGKGSKRLASLAIQSAVVRDGGIMLVDEVEQGLEPDRIKQLVRHLKEQKEGQIFITTHSRDVITELGADPLLFLLKNKDTDDIEKRDLSFSDNDDLQKTVRACPEAFFAKKVIVCEGATEIGICRAMDKWRKDNSKPQMSFKDCAYIDATGNTLVQRVDEINAVKIKTALFCDSDLPTINEKKEQWKEDGVSIFDCEMSLCLEEQVFKDLAWDGVKELLRYAQEHNKDSFNQLFSDRISQDIDAWNDDDTLRQDIILKIRQRNWFKAIHHGEFIGEVIFNNFDEMNENVHLKSTLSKMSDWIDED